MEEHRAGFSVPPLPLTSDRPVTGPSSHSEETKDVMHQDSEVLFMACYKINEKSFLEVASLSTSSSLAAAGSPQSVVRKRRHHNYVLHHSHPAFFHSKKDRVGTAQLVQHLTETVCAIQV